MATTVDSNAPRLQTEEKFFFILGSVMATTIVAGFALNLAMGRSTFAVPVIYHVHAFVFFGWVVLYLTQNGLIASGQERLHRKLGWLSALWVPAMVVLGSAMTIVAMRRTGGPFFFDQNEFMFSNPLMLICFAGLVTAALLRHRKTDWHRRFMLVALSILTGPGLGRLLPTPLLIPHAWRIIIAVTLVFPVIGMIHDRRRYGRVHPAWYVGIGAIILTQVLADLLAYSDWGIDLTRDILAGTPGTARSMAAHLP